MINKKKIIKYLATGGISFVVEYGSFMILVYPIAVDAWIGQIASYCLTIIVNFLLLRNWAFSQDKDGRLSGHITKYASLIVFNLLITTILIYLLTSANVPAFIAKLVVIILTTIWNYILYDRVVFRESVR